MGIEIYTLRRVNGGTPYFLNDKNEPNAVK